MAVAPRAPQTVAKQQFQDFRTDQVVDTNFNTSQALSRALKIFLISFGEYERICPQLYQLKFAEYMNAMQTLYGVQNFDQTMIANQLNSLSTEKIKVTIGVKLFRGRRLVTNPKIIIINGLMESKWIPLNTTQPLQTNVKYFETMPFDDLINNRKRKIDIVIILEGSQWKMAWSQLNQFAISYDQIPVEGYEDWFYFGRGVRLLIKINFNVVNQSDKKIGPKFHLHSIIYMIRERLLSYRNRPNVGPTHRRICRKYRVTYIRKRVEQITEQAFWSPPIAPENILQSIQSMTDEEEGYSRIKAILRNDVKFNDLQIGFRFTDNFDDKICLCSQWCNWNAFFYYNPMYRFLLVQNNQLFLEDRTNVADIYLFASTFCAYEAGLNLQPNQTLPPTPVLRLMNCANDYRNTMYQNFYLKNQQFKGQYNNSFPDPRFLNGLTYNLIRNEIQLADLWLQSDVNPFSDVCIENICNFYRLYSELHLWCSTRTSLVSKDDNKKWFKELDQTSRKQFRTYLKLSYDKRMANKLTSYDYLFTEDYENSYKMGDKYIKSIRDNVLKMGLNDNPLNVRVIYNDLLSTFVSIYKFVRIVEPSIPMINTLPSLVDVFQCFKTMDTDFSAFANNSEFDFKFDEQLIRRKNLEQMREVLTIFFALKLYFVASDIQTNCINSLLKVKSKVKLRPEQITTEFNFIWNSRLIEQKLRKDFPNKTLFEINANIEQSFDEFYEIFWGRADHELNPYSQYAPNIVSAYFQYQRLYFWWRNDGNNKFKFRAFIDSLTIGLEDVLKQSENIYLSYILVSIRDIYQTYDYYLEVLDVLVLYLAKADCYMIRNSIAVFIRKVHSLQIQSLVSKRVCYCMCKPGWVPIFRTLRTCLQYVDRIESLYIVFDDEFNKLSVIFRETKRMIKEFYRDFYKKLVTDWLQEINRLGGLRNLYPSSEEFISMHLAVGHSFMVAFIDDFRPQSRFYRKFLMSVLDFTSQAPHQQILNQYIVVCENYVTQSQQVQTALPLLWPTWQQEIASVDFNHFNQMTEKDLQIDLNAANS